MPRPKRILKKVKEGERWRHKNTGEIHTVDKILWKGGIDGRPKRYRINIGPHQYTLYDLWLNYEKIVD